MKKEQIQKIQREVDEIGFKGSNEYDLYLSEELEILTEQEKIDFALGFKDWCDKQFIEKSKGQWIEKYPDHTDEQLIELYQKHL